MNTKEQSMPDEKIPNLPRYVITGDAGDTLDHHIVRACRPAAVADRLNPLEDEAIAEYQRSKIAEHVARQTERDHGPEMTPELRASLDKHGSVAEWHEKTVNPKPDTPRRRGWSTTTYAATSDGSRIDTSVPPICRGDVGDPRQINPIDDEAT